LLIVPVPHDQKIIVAKQGRITKLTPEMDSLVNSLQNDTSHIEFGQGVIKISSFKIYTDTKNGKKVKSLKANNCKTIILISLKFYSW